MKVQIHSSWEKPLETAFGAPYFQNLVDFVKAAYQKTTCYPPGKDIFQAFNACPLDQLKVVIIGQDPYHGPGQAHGLSFSVPTGVRIPPSLRNIYKEIRSDIGKDTPESGDLERWAKQGVLLLNATLTVERGQPGSHQGWGWERF